MYMGNVLTSGYQHCRNISPRRCISMNRRPKVPLVQWLIEMFSGTQWPARGSFCSFKKKIEREREIVDYVFLCHKVGHVRERERDDANQQPLLAIIYSSNVQREPRRAKRRPAKRETDNTVAHVQIVITIISASINQTPMGSTTSNVVSYVDGHQMQKDLPPNNYLLMEAERRSGSLVFPALVNYERSKQPTTKNMTQRRIPPENDGPKNL